MGNRTKGFIIGSFFTSSVLSTDFALSWRKLMLEPPRRAVVAANDTTSDAFNKLPLLIRRVACGEKPESGSSTLTALLETSIRERERDLRRYKHNVRIIQLIERLTSFHTVAATVLLVMRIQFII